MFDMDGTLVDSALTIVSRVERAFANAGEPVPTQQTIRNNVGLSLEVFMGRIADTVDEGRIAGLIKAYRDIALAEKEGTMPLFDGARALLASLAERDDVIIGLATGKSRRGVDMVFAQNEIGHFFKTVQTPDSNPSKPHPGMLIEAMRAFDTEPHDTVMIGDASFDIQMAQAAGTRSIAVKWGMQDYQALMDLKPDTGCESMDCLEAAIDGVFGDTHA
jgi:phosphoglycolate phosphatase